MMNPEVGLGAVEMKTHLTCWPVRLLTSATSSAVTKPMLQIPGRGYSTATTWRKELLEDSTLSVKLFTPP